MSDQQKATEFKNLGNQAFKNKDYAQAIEHFTKAIEHNPNDHVFYSNRSGSYLNSGDYAKALEDAQQCIKMNSSWARGYQRKGTALFYMQKLDEAIKTYQEGLKHDPNSQALKNDLKAAQEKAASAANPMMNENYLQAMMKLLSNPQTKDYVSDPEFMKKAQMVIQNPAAMAMFQNDPKIKKAMQVIASDANVNFEDILKKAQNYGEKQEQKKQQTQKKQQPKPQPKKEEKKEQTKMQQQNPAEDAKNKGNKEFKNKNFQKAIQHYEEAIKINGNQPLYYNNSAAAYIQMGKYANAHEVLDKADTLFADGSCKDYVKKAKVLARRASLLSKEKKYTEAIAMYQKSLVEDNVHKVRDQMKHVKKTVEQQQKKAYINPQLAEKACEQGNALFKQGKFPDALKFYQDAIRRNPDGAKYYSNLGTVYVKLMQFQRAKQNFQICLQKDPNYVKAYGKKGDCHYFLKQYHKALSTYEKGLQLDPGNQICDAGIKKTQQAIYMSGAGTQEQQQQRAQRAMADPQIQGILNTPQVQNALKDLQSNPAAIQNIMKNPSLAKKIDKLVQAGVIGMG